MSISACDTKVSMLMTLLLANKRILSYFFLLFPVMVINFLIIPIVKEKIKVKLVLAIPTGLPTTLLNEIIDTRPVVAFKTIKILSMSSKAVIYFLNFLLHAFLCLISR